MGVYRRGDVWWYRFNWNGKRVRESTKQSNRRVAQQIEAAHRTQLAKGEVGISDRTKVPTLSGFTERFQTAVETANPKMVNFYMAMMKPLLRFASLANARLDYIDEALIQSYIEWRGTAVSRATINRELATLRKALRLAQEWRVIDRVPKIRLLAGERVRDFVLKRDREAEYLAACPDPLRDIARLILDTGLRLGEALNLRWDDVNFDRGKFGYVFIRGGKTRNARRAVSLTERANETLLGRPRLCEWIFPGDSQTKPIAVTSIDHQHKKVRDALNLSEDFVVHSLRHTMLTRLGECGADAFTIMRIAGHSSVTVSARYVHPSFESMELAIERLGASGKPTRAQSEHSNEKLVAENQRKSFPVNDGRVAQLAEQLTLNQ